MLSFLSFINLFQSDWLLYLIPYFIAAHPGSDDNDMVNLALWLKRNKFKLDQVQTFYPSPMALATAMYYSGKNPLKKVTYRSENVSVIKKIEQRRLQKAFIRYHDPKNWSLIRQALVAMGRTDLIGPGKKCLVPHDIKRKPKNTSEKATLRSRSPDARRKMEGKRRRAR